ncbi:MAG TPA: ABC transporter permease [Bryobacteraceae bacterium]|nr:ABC transporter permease [Bryobacteraceae bacterium]
MDSLLRDLRHGVRLLANKPGATLLMIVALALGIGLNASSFMMVDALVLHPLPFPNLGRIMSIAETIPKLRAERDAVAPANFRDWREQSRSFDRLAAFRPLEGALTGGPEAEHIMATAVSPDFFPLLGISPELGRTFRADENEPARAGVAVVSHGFWLSRLSSSPHLLGSSLSLDGRRYTIVGVMPADFNLPLGNEIWVPLAFNTGESADRAQRSLAVLGLLRPGVSVLRARQDLHGIAVRLARAYPLTNEGREVLVTPIRDTVNEGTDRFTLVLMATAGFVLLLACVNIANMQLARAVQRQKEIAVRTAIGAGRWHILRQLLTESVLLAIPGGALGLCLAAWDMDLRGRLIPAQVYYWVAGIRNMRVDGRVVAYTFALSLIAAVLCVLPAALRLISSRMATDTSEALKECGRSSSGASSAGRMRTAFATAEVCLALVLLIGAGLMVRTFQRMLAVNAGFDPNNLLTMQTSLSATRYHADAQIRGFADRSLPALQSVPGVNEAAVDSVAPPAEAFYRQGSPEPRPGEPVPSIHAVTPRFFAALRLPLLSGRAIESSDGPAAEGVVVLSEVVARHYWPGDNPIGRRIRLHGADTRWLTVIGVCGDVREWFNGRPVPRAYVPFHQSPQRSLSLLLRTSVDPTLAATGARARMHEVDRAQPMFDIKTMQQQLAEETSGVRASAVSMIIYAAIALLLAISGVYAVVSYSVEQRTHEIGIRIALGAGRAQVVRMTLGQALRIAAVGLAIGIPAAFALMRLMSAVLYGAVALDALTFAAFAATLAACALLAGYLPARRAASTDPIAALRHE